MERKIEVRKSMKRKVKILWSDQKIKNIPKNSVIILIDILRASSLISAALNKNAEKVIVVKEKEEALEIKKNNKEYILVGERAGKKLEGFDINNSPKKIAKIGINKTIVLNSGNFCRVVEHYAARNVPVLAGSLLNAEKIAKYIWEKNYEYVYIIPVGTYHFEEKSYKKPLKTEEDMIGAFFIAYELSKKGEINMPIPEKYLSNFSNEKLFQKKFYSLKYTKYLLRIDDKDNDNQKDIEVCIALNTFPCIPVLDDKKWPYAFKNAN